MFCGLSIPKSCWKFWRWWSAEHKVQGFNLWTSPTTAQSSFRCQIQVSNQRAICRGAWGELIPERRHLLSSLRSLGESAVSPALSRAPDQSLPWWWERKTSYQGIKRDHSEQFKHVNLNSALEYVLVGLLPGRISSQGACAGSSVPAVAVTSPGGTSISVSSFKEFSAPKVLVFFKLPNLPLRCL